MKYILRRDCGRCKDGGKQCGTPMQEWCQSPRNKGVRTIKIYSAFLSEKNIFLGLPGHSFCQVHSLHNWSSLLLGSWIKVIIFNLKTSHNTSLSSTLGTVPGVSPRITSSALPQPSLRRVAASAQNVIFGFREIITLAFTPDVNKKCDGNRFDCRAGTRCGKGAKCHPKTGRCYCDEGQYQNW